MGGRRVLMGLISINVVLLAGLLTHLGRPAAAGDQDRIRTRAIELVDERGQVRAQLGVEPDGEAVLRLRDSKGEIRVKLGGGRDGSGLLLLDGSTEPAIHMLARGRDTKVTLAKRGSQPRVITP